MNYLKQKLEEKNISQSELARRLGVTRGYICDLVDGRKYFNKMPLEKIVTMANILDTSIEEFIERIIRG